MNAPFVGRERESEAILAVLERGHRSRQPAVCLVTGEAGCGKTRLLAECVPRSATGRVIRLTGFEPIQPIPLAAVGELLRELARVPRAGANLDELVFGPAPASGRDPLRIFEAAARALSGVGRLLLVIDDLQWVDGQSIALLHYLLRSAESGHLEMVIVAAARPSPSGEAFRTTLESELPPERRATIPLGRLSRAEGVSLACAMDRELDEVAAGELWRRAGGSPFWLDALVRSGDAGTDLLADRLRGLSGDASALLAALAVGARPFRLTEMADILGWKAQQAAFASAELAGRGLTIDTVGLIRLSHDLIREAAFDGLPTRARRRLHGRFAESMEAAAGDDLPLLAEALRHRTAAGLPATALASRLLASPQRRLLDPEQLRLLAAISDEAADPTDEPEHLDQQLGELAAILGEHELALQRWTRVARRSHAPGVRQHAALEAARAAFRLGRAPDAHAHLERARTAMPPDPATSVQLDALQADVELWLDHETVAGTLTADRALATARAMIAAAGGLEGLAIAGRRAYLAALESTSDAAMQEDRLDDVARLSEMMIAVAEGVDEPSFLAALTQAGLGLRPLGRARESEAHYRQAWDISTRLVLPTETVEAGHGLARALRDLGRFVEARAIAAETLDLESRLGSPPRRWGTAAAILHSIELSLGDPAAALAALRRDAAEQTDPHFRLGVHQVIATWIARFTGPAAAAEVEATLRAARLDAALARCPRCTAELSLSSAEALARIGRVEEANLEMAAWEQGPTPDDPWRRNAGVRSRAAIALAEGDGLRSASILEAQIEPLALAGMSDALLWVHLDRGRALSLVDRDGALDAYTRAAELAVDTGALSQGRLAAQALRRLGVRAWRRGRTTSGEGIGSLSERESEVARLVAGGSSNREIAERLLVSPKTVERHMTNVLAKLGLRNRTEIAALIGSAVVRDSPDE